MATVRAPETSAERIEALGELRALLAPQSQLGPYSRYLISNTTVALEHELSADVAELRALMESATVDEVKALLTREAKRIEAALSPSIPPAGSDAVDSGAVADDEGEVVVDAGAHAKPLKDKRVPAPTASPSGERKPNPFDAKPTPSAEEPAGGFEPADWPHASQASLPPDCWRSPFQAVRAVPRCRFDSKAAKRLMAERKPVILTDSGLIGEAAGKWDLAFLRANLRDVPCTVYASTTRHFRYWDEGMNEAGYAFGAEERTQKLSMGIDEFSERLQAAHDAAPSAPADAPGGTPTRYYFQTALVEGTGEELTRDFRGFDWGRLLALQRQLGWGDLTSNLLLVGQAGNTTPAHYDEQQNLFAQLHGTKRCVLFSPADYRCLYPFPVHHPCDRQSQVDLYAPDVARFPRFREAVPLEAVLSPGDVLYIPQYWWHHIENLSHACVSLNFWYKDTARPQKITLPLTVSQHLAMRRNIEKFVASEVGARRAHAVMPRLDAATAAGDDDVEIKGLRDKVATLLGHVMDREAVGPWLRELVDGRFELPAPPLAVAS